MSSVMKAVAVLAIVMIASVSICYARDQKYEALQVALKIDGSFNEWQGSDVIVFDQLKDVGARVPDPKDFTGTGMVGWNSSDPDRIYFAATIVDDKNQDTHPANQNHWEDDSLELMFDFDNDARLTQWTIDANGKEVSAAGTEENLEWIVVNQGNNYFFEGAIDPTKDNPDRPGQGVNFKAKVGQVVGLSFHFNDCENGAREHQIGWTAGKAWEAPNYGDLIFSVERAAVDSSGKLTVTWGRLKT